MAASLTFDILARDRASRTLSKVGAEASKTSRVFNKFGLLAATGGAIAGAALIKFGKDSVSAFSDAQQAQTRLEDAFKRFPRLADVNIDSLRELNTQLALKTRFDDDAFASGQAVLAQFKLTGQQLKQVTPLLADFAAKTGRDLPDAATILGKAFLGNTRALKALGISYKSTGDQAADTAAVIDLVRQKVGGFAEKEGKTAAGRAEILKNQFGELQEAVGSKLVPALSKVADIIIDELIPAFTDFNTWLDTTSANMLDKADTVLEFADVLLTLDSVILGFVSRGVKNFLLFGDIVTTSFVKALGWVPVLGDRLRDAEKDYQKFRDGVTNTLDDAIAKTNQWDNSVERMRKEIKLKGDIRDLDAKLASARRQLKDPNLTKTREAKLRAEIGQLLAAKSRAQNAINSLRGKTIDIYAVFHPPTGGRALLEAGARQHGGPVDFNRPYLVGEKEAEILYRGRVYPGGHAPPELHGMGGGTTVINFSFPNYVGSRSDLVAAMRREIRVKGGNVQTVLGS